MKDVILALSTGAVLAIVFSTALLFSTPVLALDTDGDGSDDVFDSCPQQSGKPTVDTTPGTERDILFLEFCSGKVDSGDPALLFNVRLSSSFSSTNSIQVLYWLENSDQTWLSIPRDPLTGDFQLEQALNKYAGSGTYIIRALRMTDNAELDVRLNESQLRGLGFNVSTVLSNPLSDDEPPYVVAMTSSGWVIKDGFPEIEFTLNAADDLSGLQSGFIIELNSPAGSSIQQWAYFNESGEGKTTYRLSEYGKSGTYTVNTIRLYDNAGNSNFSSPWISNNPTDFTLDNPNEDPVAPELKAFNLLAEFNNEANRPVIIVEGAATDNLSGVTGIYLRLNRPEGGIFDRWLWYGAPSARADFDNTLALTTQFIEGVYSLEYLRLTDAAENEVSLSGKNLDTKSFSSSVSVYFPTEDEVKSGRTIVSGSAEDDYVFGANNSNDSITAGAGDDYIYTGSGDDNVDAGAGDKDMVVFSGAISGYEISYKPSKQITVTDIDMIDGNEGANDLKNVEFLSFVDTKIRALDSDLDGVGDNADAFPQDASEQVDTDGDGVGDNADAFPQDASEWADTDGDGVGDNADDFPLDPTVQKIEPRLPMWLLKTAKDKQAEQQAD